MSHIKPRQRTVPIYQGDDLERIAELRLAATQAERHATEALEAAKEAAKGEALRSGDDDPVVEARAAFATAVKPTRDAYDAFVEEAAERACMVELHEIGSKRFRDLRLAHPPRMVGVTVEADPDDPDDSGVTEQRPHEDDGHPFYVNTETFPRALLTYIDGDKRTIAQPEFASAAAIGDFLDDDVNEGDLAKLWMVAFNLNGAVGADPKASRFSPAPQDSSGT